MKKIFFAIIAVLAAFYAHADRMYIDNFSIEAGETKQVSINLTNDDVWSAFQLEMTLPDGLAMAKDSRGRLRCAANEDRKDDHTLSFSDQGNGQYKAVYYSPNSYEIYGNSGEIVRIWVTADAEFKGTATISLKEIYMSDVNGNLKQLDNTTCTVTGPNAPEPQPGSNSMFIDDFSIEAGETKQVSINLTNDDVWSAFQLEMTLPDGLAMAKDSRGRLRCAANEDRKDDHTLSFSDQGNGQYKAVYYSPNSYEIYGNSGEIVSIWVTADAEFKGTATISLKEIYMSDVNGNLKQLDNTTCTVTGVILDIKATSVSLDKSTLTMTTGDITTLTATVLPENATDKSVTWTSSNTAVATVANGKVTAVAPGNATITAQTVDGTNLTATCEVTVADNIVATDGQTYEDVNGLKIENLWIMDRVHTPKEFQASPLAKGTYARMATLKDDVVYVSRSGAQLAVTEENDSILQCVVYRYDANTGARLADLPLTLDGKPYGTKEAASLYANNIGTDHFGHMWIAPYTNETSSVQKIYKLDDNTGELSLVAELDKGDALARVDYLDLVGDITREKAMCTIMGMGSQVATVYRWQAQQGYNFKVDIKYFTKYYPETVTHWGFVPYVKIRLGDACDQEGLYRGDYFWCDGFTTAPTLYHCSGEIITSFEPVAVDNPELVPHAYTNGVTEFNLKGRNFIAYSLSDYNNGGCQANICELGPNKMLKDMKHYWTIPADALGKVSDSGTRIHCLNAQKGVDAEGNEEITLLTYKCYNGIGIYKIGNNVGGDDPNPALPGDINGDGQVDIDDANILIDIILGKDDAGKYNGRADVNKDGNVDIDDLNTALDKLLGK